MIKFCDWHCIYARFPKETALDGAGSCRTFQAVWCQFYKRLVPKNIKCKKKEEEL